MKENFRCYKCYLISLILWIIIFHFKIKVKVQSCEKCSGMLSPVSGPTGDLETEKSPTITKLQQENRELEMELAKTKLALVESECKNQVR